MCDFHSTVWRLLGQDAQCAHDSQNSHSEAVQKAGWRDNEPNRKINLFEAEWNGEGDLPSDEKLVRNSGECPEKLMIAIRRHYLRLQKFIQSGKEWKHFADIEKWADVWGKIKVLPADVKFPAQFGYLDLSSLTSLPADVKFPAECGYLDLRSLTSLPADVKFPAECGSLDLRSDLKAQLPRKEE